MKKIYLLLISCLSLNFLIAQPNLTPVNSNPVVGESLTIHTSIYYPPGSAGANQTWDFSSAVDAGSNTFVFVTASSTPNASQYPQANLAVHVPASNNYSYYKANNSEYSLVGIDVPSLGQTYNYADPENYLVFPMTYNSTYSDSFLANITAPGQQVVRSGIVTLTGDAYGDISLPFGTYTGVLRVHVQESFHDVNQLGDTTTYQSDVYQWYLPGTHYPVLYVNTLTKNGALYSQAGAFLDETSIASAPTFVADVKGSMFKIYPNPADSYLKISSANYPLSVKLYDDCGREVLSQELEGDGEMINLEGLPAGVYIVTAQNGDKIRQDKLVIK